MKWPVEVGSMLYWWERFTTSDIMASLTVMAHPRGRPSPQIATLLLFRRGSPRWFAFDLVGRHLTGWADRLGDLSGSETIPPTRLMLCALGIYLLNGNFPRDYVHYWEGLSIRSRKRGRWWSSYIALPVIGVSKICWLVLRPRNESAFCLLTIVWPHKYASTRELTSVGRLETYWTLVCRWSSVFW